MCGKCGTFSVFCVFSWLSPKLDASFIQAGGRQRAPAAVSNFQIAGAAGKGLPAAAAAPFSAVIYLVFLNIRTAFANYTTVYPKTQRSQSQLIKSSQKPLFRQPFRPVGPSVQPVLALPGRAPLLPPGMSRALHGPFFRPLPAFAMYSDASYKTSSSIRSSGNHFPRNSGIYCIPSSEGRSLW